jgi:hypothetical protein
VYEDEAGKTFVAYDNFVSLLAQYQREEITKETIIYATERFFHAAI